MDFYRVSCTVEDTQGEHAGYSWFTSEYLANGYMNKMVDEGFENVSVQKFSCKNTVRSVYKLLLEVATHPDNG